MKKIDFSQPGGFPLTQDQLSYLQQSYTESALAVATMGHNGGAPFIVSGMTITNPSIGEYSVTSGWFYYNDDLIRFTSNTITGASGSFAPFIVISPVASPLVFNDGSTPPVITDSTATIQSLPTSTPADATHIPLLQVQPFGRGFGIANKETSWQIIPVSTPAGSGGVTGNIFYRKNHLTNTLHIRGTLTSANAQNFAASPGSTFYTMATLPSEYAPANTVYLIVSIFGSTSFKDDLNVSWIKQINCGINTAGQIFLNWIRPELAVAGYGINFNTVVPLD